MTSERPTRLIFTGRLVAGITIIKECYGPADCPIEAARHATRTDRHCHELTVLDVLHFKDNGRGGTACIGLSESGGQGEFSQYSSLAVKVYSDTVPLPTWGPALDDDDE
jgi:hypothetical protein